MGDNAETAVLAGGCAWTMQQLLRHPEGVIATRTGFMGGENDNPTEENNIGHAEVVEVIFDPERLSYRGLLEVFFQVHRADRMKASLVRNIAPRPPRVCLAADGCMTLLSSEYEAIRRRVSAYPALPT